jgi:hypothetical protein
MSTNPSWLTEDVVAKAAKNPVAQQVAQNVAKDVANDIAKNPEPYVAAYAASNNNFRSTSGGDVERGPIPSVSEPGADMTDQELKEVKRAHIVLRVLYIITSGCMAAAAFLALAGANFSVFFIAGYVFFFSALLCCFETGLGVIAQCIAINFGFMYSTFGRILFILFLAVMCYSLNTLFGLIDMCILVAVLALHLYVMFKYPKFSEYVRRMHYFAAGAGGGGKQDRASV